VDVVTVDGIVSSDPELTLPHPGAHERVSVLLPWHDVQPDAVLPGHGPIARLLDRLDQSPMRRRDDLALRPSGSRPEGRPPSPDGLAHERAAGSGHGE
jgi:hypothetical protein